jgi:spoIIIJ-associated protein
MDQATVSAPPPVTVTPLDPLQTLQTLLDTLGLPGTVAWDQSGPAAVLHITTEEPGRIIGRRGATISSLQFLLNRMLVRHDPNAPRVTVNCERPTPPPQPHDEVLQRCAEASDKVRRWGDPVLVGPFTPEERQAIHDRYATDVEIEAIAEGGNEGLPKKMMFRIRQAPLAAPVQARHL